MAQFEQLQNNQQIFEKVENHKEITNGKFDNKEILEEAVKVFKSISDAAKNSKDVHEMNLQDDSKSKDLQGDASSKAGKDSVIKAVESIIGAGHKQEGGKGSTSDGEATSDKHMQGTHEKNNSGASGAADHQSIQLSPGQDRFGVTQFPTETANPTPGTVTLEPYHGGTAHVLHLGEISTPARPTLPAGVTRP